MGQEKKTPFQASLRRMITPLTYLIFFYVIQWQGSIFWWHNYSFKQKAGFLPFPILGYADTPPPSPQFWSGFYGRCEMCWIECKTIIRFLFFRIIVKNSLKIIHCKLGYKNDYNLKNKNRKNLKIGFFFYSADFRPSMQISKI